MLLTVTVHMAIQGERAMFISTIEASIVPGIVGTLRNIWMPEAKILHIIFIHLIGVSSFDFLPSRTPHYRMAVLSLHLAESWPTFGRAYVFILPVLAVLLLSQMRAQSLVSLLIFVVL